MRNMKFVSLYKGIILTVQGKCVKCTMMYKAPNRFCTIFKQLEFDIKTIIDSFYFILYQTMSLRHSLQKSTHRK